MADFDIEVLRLGHRVGRDPRITTHLALVSRAMGAKGFILSGDKDNKLFSNIRSVNDRFGPVSYTHLTLPTILLV